VTERPDEQAADEQRQMSADAANAASGRVHRARPTGEAARPRIGGTIASALIRAVRKPSSRPLPPLRLPLAERGSRPAH
jgi:hypothetical protein